MSIIYDALKKTQTHRAETISSTTDTPSKLHRRRLRLNKYWLIFFALVPIIILFSMFIPFKKNQPIPVIKQPAYRTPALVLNGIFISDQTKVAMINNRLLKLGDSIYHLKVVDIEFDRVTLQNQQKTLVLKT